MSVNESGLNRTTKKDTQLQTKLINLRKKRDAAVKKVERISNKNKITSGEIRRFNQHRKDLTTIESNITKEKQLIIKREGIMNKIQRSQTINQAVDYKRQGEYYKALKLYDILLNEYDDYEIYNARAKINFIIGKFQESMNDYVDSVKLFIEQKDLASLIQNKRINQEEKMELNRSIKRIQRDYSKHLGAAYRSIYKSIYFTNSDSDKLYRIIRNDYRATIDPFFAGKSKPLLEDVNSILELNTLLIEVGLQHLEYSMRTADQELVMKKVIESKDYEHVKLENFSMDNMDELKIAINNPIEALKDEERLSGILNICYKVIEERDMENIYQAEKALYSLYQNMNDSNYEGKMQFYYSTFNVLTIMDKFKINRKYLMDIDKNTLLRKSLIEGNKKGDPDIETIAPVALNFFETNNDYLSIVRMLDFNLHIFTQDKIIAYLLSIIMNPEKYKNDRNIQEMIDLLDYYTQQRKLKVEDVSLESLPHILFYSKLSTITAQAHLNFNNEVHQFTNRIFEALTYVQIVLEASPDSYQFIKLFIEFSTSLLKISSDYLSQKEISQLLTDGSYWSEKLKQVQTQTNTGKHTNYVIEQFLIEKSLVLANKFQDYEGAHETLKNGLIDLESRAALNALAEISIMQQKYTHALRYLEQSLLVKHDYYTFYLMAIGFLKIEDYDQAERFILIARAKLKEVIKSLLNNLKYEDAGKNGYIQQKLWKENKEISIQSILILKTNENFELASTILYEDRLFLENDQMFTVLSASLKKIETINNYQRSQLAKAMTEAKNNAAELEIYQNRYKEIIETVLDLKDKEEKNINDNERDDIEEKYHQVALGFMNETKKDKRGRGFYRKIEKEIKREYPVLTEESAAFLITAEFLYKSHKDFLTDFSPIMIEYGKLLEYELRKLLQENKVIDTRENIKLYNLIETVSQHTPKVFPDLEGFGIPAHKIRSIRNDAAHGKLCGKPDILYTRDTLFDKGWLIKILES